MRHPDCRVICRSGRLSPGAPTLNHGPHVRVHILPAVKTRQTNARVVLLAADEGCDECVDFLLIRTLAAGVDARTGGVTDPQYNLVRPRRVVDQHRSRIKGIEIPTLVEGPIDQVDGRARRAYLGVARNDNATAFDRAAHRHAESRMYHRSAMLEVASDADQRRLGVGAQLRWARAKCRQRRLGERSPEFERIFDQRFKVGAGRFAGERVLEHRGNRDTSQRGAGGRAVLTIDLLDESDGLADGHDVFPLLVSNNPQQILSVQVSWTKGSAIDVRVESIAPMTEGSSCFRRKADLPAVGMKVLRRSAVPVEQSAA